MKKLLFAFHSRFLVLISRWKFSLKLSSCWIERKHSALIISLARSDVISKHSREFFLHPTVQFSSMETVDRRIEYLCIEGYVHPRILVTHWPTGDWNFVMNTSWRNRRSRYFGLQVAEAAIFQGISNGLLSGRIWNELVPGKVATGSSFLVVFRRSVVSLKDPSRPWCSSHLNQCLVLDLYSFRDNKIFNCRINEKFSLCDSRWFLNSTDEKYYSEVLRVLVLQLNN